MLHYEFACTTRFIIGPGRLQELGQLAADEGARRVLVVTDPGIIAAGHAPRGVAALESRSIVVEVFDEVEENPTTTHVDAGLAVAKDFRPDLIIGLGGGSSMDCAKGINFLYSCGGRMHDYWGTGKATGPLLPMLAVPTTAGTGSEAQSYALISDAETHVKMACGDPRAAFRVAILDPELTLTQPPRVTALTGIDALAHAIETFVTKRRNQVSQMLSHDAFRRLVTSFPRVLQDPTDIVARAETQVGACLAGLAIENSMLGAAHALANPLTAVCGVAHGEAVGLMLPHVIRFNGRMVDASYAELVNDLVDSPGEDASETLATLVEQLRHQAGLAGTLSESGVAADQLPTLAAAAAQQWTGQFNPVPLTHDDFLQLYRTAL